MSAHNFEDMAQKSLRSLDRDRILMYIVAVLIASVAVGTAIVLVIQANRLEEQANRLDRLAEQIKVVDVMLKLNEIERNIRITNDAQFALQSLQNFVSEYEVPQLMPRIIGLQLAFSEVPNPEIAELERAADEGAGDGILSTAESTLLYYYINNRQFKEAIDFGEDLIEEGAATAEIYNNVAWALFNIRSEQPDDLEQALHFANEAVSRTQNRNTDYVDTLARIYMEQGRHDEALNVIDKSLRHDKFRHLRELREQIRERKTSQERQQ